MNLLDLDARWKRFNDPDRACPCCGRQFGGVFDIGFEEPQDWPHGPRDSDDMLVGEDRLTADLCRLDGRYFLRATMPLAIRGAGESLNISLWAEVSRETLHGYLDSIDSVAPFSAEGLTANPVPGIEEDAVPIKVEVEDSGQRPVARATEGPVAAAQSDGISFDDLLDIYAAGGNDIRPHLTA